MAVGIDHARGSIFISMEGDLRNDSKDQHIIALTVSSAKRVQE